EEEASNVTTAPAATVWSGPASAEGLVESRIANAPLTAATFPEVSTAHTVNANAPMAEKACVVSYFPDDALSTMVKFPTDWWDGSNTSILTEATAVSSVTTAAKRTESPNS